VVWSEDLKRRDQVQAKALVWFDRCCQSDECDRVTTIYVRFKLDENRYPKVCRASGSFAAFVASMPRRRRFVKAEAEIVLLSKLSDAAMEMQFVQLRDAIVKRVTLSHPDSAQALCLYADASQEFYATVLTRMPVEDLEKHTDEQRHEPLAFISEQFVRSFYNWSVPEKEAFEIVAAKARLKYLTLVRKVHAHADHRNLVYIFDPRSTNPNVANYVLSKLNRWGVVLSEFDYDIYHIQGGLNHFADLMTRWSVSRIRGLVVAPLSTPDAAGEKPDYLLELVKRAQKDMTRSEWDRLDLKQSKGLYCVGTRVYVPRSAVDVKIRLLIAAHCGRGGHRPAMETKLKLLKNFVWDDVVDDVDTFLSSCLHCAANDGPMTHTLHATKPNQLLHFDFLLVGPNVQGYVYILIFKDDLSNFVWPETLQSSRWHKCNAGNRRVVCNVWNRARVGILSRTSLS
jgi:RNase H-like domain found in reverse transcriptase